jgi:UDP-GlcNAc:undecaprenyl-phosphate GlcNAc-1-phosphate transferase
VNRLIFHALLAFALTAFLSHFLRRPALRVGLVDVPGGRKQHAGEIPVVGGIAMFCGFTFSLFGIGQLESLNLHLSLVCALALMVMVGALDDMHDLSARHKFAAQIVGALFMTSWAGNYVSQIGNLLGFGPLGLYNWAIPFTVVCVLGVINAVNMLDGLDGLAGSVCGGALVLMAVAAGLSGLETPLWIAVLMLSAVAGFLLLNLRLPWQSHARVFMGDAGSMMLGFALVWLAVDLSQGASRTLPPIVAVWILALPLADMARVMLTRMLRGQSPFLADRIHLHHLLIARGFSNNRVVMTMAGLSAAGGVIGIAGWKLGVPDYALFYAFIVVLAIYCFKFRGSHATNRPA